MELKWLGKYRFFVEKMIRYGNSYSRFSQNTREYAPSVSFSASQIQVVEYILENEELNLNMAQTAARLGVSSSAFTKIVQKLTKMGFLEKYHMKGNRKDVIIRVSERGKEAYALWSDFILKNYFQDIFDILDEIPEEHIERFTKIMALASSPSFENDSPKDSSPALIRIE